MQEVSGICGIADNQVRDEGCDSLIANPPFVSVAEFCQSVVAVMNSSHNVKRTIVSNSSCLNVGNQGANLDGAVHLVRIFDVSAWGPQGAVIVCR